MEKNFVSMEQRICNVCGIKHSYDCGILIDKRLEKSMDHETLVGYGLCEEHSELQKQGYVFLVVIDPAKSKVVNEDRVLKMENAYRTGELVSIKKEVADKLFDVNIQDIMFIDEEACEKIKSLIK